jgi:hypothetical protein
MKLSGSEIAVIALNCLYLAAGLAAAARGGNIEFVLYVAVVFLLLLIVAAIHLKIRFHIVTLWGLSLWGMAHMAGGLMPVPSDWPRSGEGSVLYNLWLVPGLLKFDQLVHAYGFGLVTWMCWQGLQFAFLHRAVQIAPTAGLLTLCVAGGMGFGAANEVVEFAAMLTLPETNVGGYENTGWDLVANAVGSLFAAAVIYSWPRTPAANG